MGDPAQDVALERNRGADPRVSFHDRAMPRRLPNPSSPTLPASIRSTGGARRRDINSGSFSGRRRQTVVADTGSIRLILVRSDAGRFPRERPCRDGPRS